MVAQFVRDEYCETPDKCWSEAVPLGGCTAHVPHAPVALIRHAAGHLIAQRLHPTTAEGRGLDSKCAASPFPAAALVARPQPKPRPKGPGPLQRSTASCLQSAQQSNPRILTWRLDQGLSVFLVCHSPEGYIKDPLAFDPLRGVDWGVGGHVEWGPGCRYTGNT